MRSQSAKPTPALCAPTSEEADPRHRRGRRHQLGCIVLIALCAVLTGARSLTAIGQWAANAPQHTLARQGARITCPALGIRQPPSPATIRRVLTGLDPGALTRMATAQDLAVLVVDGKCVRGSRTRQDKTVHLLAAMPPAGHVAAQVLVADKTSEIDALAGLLQGLDIEGSVISADALRHLAIPLLARAVSKSGERPVLPGQGILSRPRGRVNAS